MVLCKQAWGSSDAHWKLERTRASGLAGASRGQSSGQAIIQDTYRGVGCAVRQGLGGSE